MPFGVHTTSSNKNSIPRWQGRKGHTTPSFFTRVCTFKPCLLGALWRTGTCNVPAHIVPGGILPGARPGGRGPMSGPGVGASGGMTLGPRPGSGTLGGLGGRKSGPGEGGVTSGTPGTPGTDGPSMFGGGWPGMPGPGSPPGWPPGGSMPPGRPPGPMSNSVATHPPRCPVLGVHTGGWSKNASLPDRCTSGASKVLAARRPAVTAARTLAIRGCCSCML